MSTGTPDRAFINNFLKVNGISADSSDTDIRKVLEDARWTKEEIDVALFILRGDVDDSGIVAFTKHDTALFRPDINIGSKNLSRLLGVDVIVDPSLIKSDSKKRAQRSQLREELAIWVIIILLSVILALVVAWLLLFTMKIGPYRQITPWI